MSPRSIANFILRALAAFWKSGALWTVWALFMDAVDGLGLLADFDHTAVGLKDNHVCFQKTSPIKSFTLQHSVQFQLGLTNSMFPRLHIRWSHDTTFEYSEFHCSLAAKLLFQPWHGPERLHVLIVEYGVEFPAHEVWESLRLNWIDFVLERWGDSYDIKASGGEAGFAGCRTQWRSAPLTATTRMRTKTIPNQPPWNPTAWQTPRFNLKRCLKRGKNKLKNPKKRCSKKKVKTTKTEPPSSLRHPPGRAAGGQAGHGGGGAKQDLPGREKQCQTSKLSSSFKSVSLKRRISNSTLSRET